MIVVELTEDRFGKAMKAISKITESAECLEMLFEDLASDHEESRLGYRKHYDDDDFYGSRYGMRRNTRRM